MVYDFSVPFKPNALPAVQKDGHRPLIHEFDLHPLLKAASLAVQACATDTLDKELIEAPRVDWRSRSVERWTLAPAHVAIQRELRDREHAAAHVPHTEVHLSI